MGREDSFVGDEGRTSILQGTPMEYAHLPLGQRALNDQSATRSIETSQDNIPRRDSGMPPGPSLWSATFSASSASVESNLLSHSWIRPSTMSLFDMISYIGSIERKNSAHVTQLQWCKDKHGIPHEFLLLRVESSDRLLWLRLDKRSHRDTNLLKLLFLTSPCADTVSTPRHGYDLYRNLLC